MTTIMLLIAALNSAHVHGTKKQCDVIVDRMVDLALSDATNPFINRHSLDSDIDALKKFRVSCKNK